MKCSAILVSLLIVLAACGPSASPDMTPIPASPTTTVEVPTGLPLSLLTPQVTSTSDTARIPVRVENPRAAYAAYVTPTGGSIKQINIPATTAGYWRSSAPLGQGGNTVIIGFESPGILGTFTTTKVDDQLLITDQQGLTSLYRVTSAGSIDNLVTAAQPTTTEQVTLIGISDDLTFFKVVAVSAS